MSEIAYPLLASFEDPIKNDLRARDLVFEPCTKNHAIKCISLWHSRLPNMGSGPMQFAFHGHQGGQTYVVALLSNPIARTLPANWIELRRMACAPNAPRNTASRFLGWMLKYFSAHYSERERIISYQDTAVHQGTIYKAAGWTAAHVSVARVRDRSVKRTGTNRLYRSNVNGSDADASSKVRWEKLLNK